jgi:hypothetical protein
LSFQTEGKFKSRPDSGIAVSMSSGSYSSYSSSEATKEPRDDIDEALVEPGSASHCFLATPKTRNCGLYIRISDNQWKLLNICVCIVDDLFVVVVVPDRSFALKKRSLISGYFTCNS